MRGGCVCERDIIGLVVVFFFYFQRKREERKAIIFERGFYFYLVQVVEHVYPTGEPNFWMQTLQYPW